MILHIKFFFLNGYIAYLKYFKLFSLFKQFKHLFTFIEQFLSQHCFTFFFNIVILTEASSDSFLPNY